MEVEEIIKIVIQKLQAIIFDIEQLKGKIIEKKYTIEVKDINGKVIESINM